jgi:Tfp pilus assembly protein PilN
MINLLPQNAKQELQQEEGFRLLLILLFMCMVALVSFALMLGVIKVYVAGSLFTQESKIALLQDRFSKDNPLLADIQEFNETTGQVSRFIKSRRSVSSVLEALAEILPGGMYFTAFDYDPPGIQAKKGGEAQEVGARISVAGFAKTRETLFLFRESLEKHPLFADLSFPASNWVLPQDIRFSFQISIAQ